MTFIVGLGSPPVKEAPNFNLVGRFFEAVKKVQSYASELFKNLKASYDDYVSNNCSHSAQTSLNNMGKLEQKWEDFCKNAGDRGKDMRVARDKKELTRPWAIQAYFHPTHKVERKAYLLNEKIQKAREDYDHYAGCLETQHPGKYEKFLYANPKVPFEVLYRRYSQT